MASSHARVGFMLGNEDKFLVYRIMNNVFAIFRKVLLRLWKHAREKSMRTPNDFINVYGTLPKLFWTMKMPTMLTMILDELHLDVYHLWEVQIDSIHLNEPTRGMFQRESVCWTSDWIMCMDTPWKKERLRIHKDKNAFRVPEEWRTKEKENSSRLRKSVSYLLGKSIRIIIWKVSGKV